MSLVFNNTSGSVLRECLNKVHHFTLICYSNTHSLRERGLWLLNTEMTVNCWNGWDHCFILSKNCDIERLEYTTEKKIIIQKHSETFLKYLSKIKHSITHVFNNRAAPTKATISIRININILNWISHIELICMICGRGVNREIPFVWIREKGKVSVLTHNLGNYSIPKVISLSSK